jgi:hypothetical protein
VLLLLHGKHAHSQSRTNQNGINFFVGVADGTNSNVCEHERAQTREEKSTMKTDLEARRQKLLVELAQIDRQIAQAQKRLAHIEARFARASQSREKAA